MRSEPEVLDLLRRWAEQQANVRTVILTSSRAGRRRQPDVLSDFVQLEYVVLAGHPNTKKGMKR